MLTRPHAKKGKEMIAPVAITPACAYFHANTRTLCSRGDLVRSHGGIGCSWPKLHLHLSPLRIFNAPSHILLAHAVPLCEWTPSRVALGRNSATSVRLRSSSRVPARSRLLHLKECFQTLFLITLSQHHSSHSSWNPHPLPNSIELYGNDNAADSDDEHTKD
ncbi:hypothetical protein PIB30_084850 [Stylosanthes scabra]|uniref:Uncharacterized protein n=1 Tax=Stylosanthes scabra TaxID=79078 RepID=A0ABU6WSH4_9FABA|nr:hypothetical protein [Stylosanthes scabra]